MARDNGDIDNVNPGEDERDRLELKRNPETTEPFHPKRDESKFNKTNELCTGDRRDHDDELEAALKNPRT